MVETGTRESSKGLPARRIGISSTLLGIMAGGPGTLRFPRPAAAGRGLGRGERRLQARGPAFRARGPSPADLRSSASPAARARRYGRWRGRRIGPSLPPRFARRPRRCAGEAIRPLPRPQNRVVTSGNSPIPSPRGSGERVRERGEKASSPTPGFRARGPSPADLRSSASPAARARRYGRWRGRRIGPSLAAARARRYGRSAAEE